jgi:HTH-type transcriptional regulator/antitoxin HigA
MTNHDDTETTPPGARLRDMLDERGWNQTDLADILGRQASVVTEILSGKRAINPEIARALEIVFGTPAAEEWLRLEQAFKLAQLRTSDDSVARRARMYALAPVNEMTRRGWINPTSDPDVLESQLLRFFRRESLDEISQPIQHFARKSTPYSAEVTPSQRAWIARAALLSKAVYAAPFDHKNVIGAVKRLKTLLVEPRELHQVPGILSAAGIRLVIVQPLASSRIDGACIWIDESPVIALSLRFDRVDSFWYTLLHEMGHCFKEQASIDTDIDSPEQGGATKPPQEVEADEFAHEHLMRTSALENFIARKSPIFSTLDIIAFARTQGVHPGIVVGQLQHRQEIAWSKFRKLLVPVREHITASALTDGWGVSVPSML